MTNQLPAYLQNRQSKAVAAALRANLGAGSPPYLSIEGNRLTLVDAVGNALPVQTYDPQIGPYIDVNIVDVNNHISKIFFDPDTPYDPKATERLPPLCWSDNGVGPSRQASNPQSPTCAACPNNVWGSATSKVTGKGIKACSDLQKLAFTTAGHKTVFLLRIPPNSLTEMRAYTGKFASGEVGDITDVVTRIYFKQGIQGTLQFQAVSYIDEATAALREAIAVAKSADAIVGRLDTVHPAMLGLPAPGTIAMPPGPYIEPSPMAFAYVGGGGAPAGPAIGGNGQAAPFPAGPASPAFQPGPAPVVASQPTPTASQSTSPAETATPAASPSRRRGRPPVGSAATAQAAPATQAPFPTTQPVTPFPASAPPPGNNFGIQPGVPPSKEISDTLNNLFGPR